MSKSNLFVYFLMWQNLLISGEKTLMSAEFKEYVTWFIHFLDLPYVRYNCAKFHHCRICVVDFREDGPKRPPHPWVASKKPILNRVKESWYWKEHFLKLHLGVYLRTIFQVSSIILTSFRQVVKIHMAMAAARKIFSTFLIIRGCLS